MTEEYPEKLNLQVVEGPQKQGIIHDQDQERCFNDPDSLILDAGERGRQIVLTPVGNNSEVNQGYFEGDSAYYLNWQAISAGVSGEALVEKIDSLPEGTKIHTDYKVDGSGEPVQYLENIVSNTRFILTPDEKAIDPQTGTIAGVHHYYSHINRGPEVEPLNCGIREAYQHLVDSGEWQAIEDDGVFYGYGPELTDDILEELWDVYDSTFDALVENHPSAQKQLKQDFLDQCKLPESHITYARDDDGIVSALFVLDDVNVCNWLDAESYVELNPGGKITFVPGISTRLNKAGLSFSPRIIGAISKIVEIAGDIDGFATQCTNRSAEYIPRIAEDSTSGTCNLSFSKIASYEYPVFTLSLRSGNES